MDVKETVNQLIKKYKTRDPFQIAKEKGIIILYQDLGTSLGYLLTYKRIHIIHINSNLDENMQHVVCAHELGHVVRHPCLNTPFMKKHTLFSVDKIEREANRFAAELLIPDDILLEYKHQTIEYIASMHNVPLELAKLKCEKLF